MIKFKITDTLSFGLSDVEELDRLELEPFPFTSLPLEIRKPQIVSS